MEKVNVDGYTISYSDQGAGEAAVLLHGFCGSSAYWNDIVPLLSSHYRLIVPDLRGHGRSDAPMGPYSIDQMADDIVKLLDHLQISKATVFGHSLGGYISLSLAERYPLRMKGFSLVHSTAYPDSEEAKKKRLQAVSSIQAHGIADFVDGLIPGLFAADNVKLMPEKIMRAKEIGYHTPPQGAIGASLAMHDRPDRRDVIANSELPVLLVAGEKDGVVPHEKTFTASKSNIIQSIIPGAGHMSMMEKPQQLANVMHSFLERITRL
ncbi:alpha/beta fold hydrolase [Paenibacillus sediminis]|uniref:Pimeloyl-ACP methyl ester carboxylesterase n=1 Tax=Paenibacillus sediminis TaxID=664909 RepID=A0ABS4H3N6_9BACL|nr:pimeloyl-ACP methyl ester carboxylesterase [Paenibacillus sediminis]